MEARSLEGWSRQSLQMVRAAQRVDRTMLARAWPGHEEGIRVRGGSITCLARCWDYTSQRQRKAARLHLQYGSSIIWAELHLLCTTETTSTNQALLPTTDFL